MKNAEELYELVPLLKHADLIVDSLYDQKAYFILSTVSTVLKKVSSNLFDYM